jgi:hypothetical protein
MPGRPVLLLSTALLIAADTALPQQPSLADGVRAVRLEADPAAIDLDAGSTVRLRITAYDADDNVVSPVLRMAASRGGLELGNGTVRALRPGEHTLVVAVVREGPAPVEPLVVTVPVRVGEPLVSRVEVQAAPGRLYQGTPLQHHARAFYRDGSERPHPVVHWLSSNPSVAAVDRFGAVTALRPGRTTISADVDGARALIEYEVAALPASQLLITGGADQARTGDVLTFDAFGEGSGGRTVADIPVVWTYGFVPADSISAPPNPAQIDQNGRFVASVPGRYTIMANAGPLAARHAVEVKERGVVRRVEVAGHGRVDEFHTTDLWVFQGRDGRDYAITGSWGGFAYFWDVTDPASLVRLDSIQLDARAIEDVKVSPDARYAVLSREGASDRRNGIVILDLAEPARPVVASRFDQGLTGGVHNLFATERYLFAVSGGEKFVILDLWDIYQPAFVAEYRFPAEGARVHDIWVQDGLAFVSQWEHGLAIVDVGNGRWGGGIQAPRLAAHFTYPSAQTHAAFPYHQTATGKNYLFVGDEVLHRSGMPLPGGLQPDRGGTPSNTSGYIHIFDWSDPLRPREVARYHVPEYGSHNFWVENDILYVAYYAGGLRLVDVSGELMGNLYEQGREIAVFKPFDPAGYVPNAPMVWGAQPHKGHVFLSDWNSGLWAVRLAPGN